MSFDPAAFPLPRALSPSRLNDFQSCPRKYEYSAVRKMRQPASYASVKGRYVHALLEELFKLPSYERTIDAALSPLFFEIADERILTEDVVADLELDEALKAKLVADATDIVRTYFTMEDPTTVVLESVGELEGIEIALSETINDAPLYGILDRLDRDEHGNLVIVDYKTGSVPKAEYVTSAFANSALYAALCENAEDIKQMPVSVRLLYIAAGVTLEKSTAELFPKQRAEAAASAWVRIKKAHAEGNFVPTPSFNACRWCPNSYKDECRRDGYDIPEPRRR